MKTIAASLLILSLTIIPPNLRAEAKSLHSSFPPGSYTGAGQIMQISSNGVPTFSDNLGICHIEIKPNDHLIADFPAMPTTNGIHFKSVFLDLKKVEPRTIWTAAYHDQTFYKVTAIPFSIHQYVFRLEAFRNGKLIGGAQQFYSLCDAKEAH